MKTDPRAYDPPWAPGQRHLTGDVPGVPFREREVPEDFVVEELPRAPSAGEGAHLVVTIEKRGISTAEAIQRIARHLGRPPGDFGFAGRKDAFAVARQRLSVEHEDPARLEGLALPGLVVLAVARDRRKLRLGDLAGNRFELVLRGLAPAHRPRVERVLETLRARGLPNYVGAQRFGRAGLGHELGRLLLAGDPAAYLAELVSERHARPSEARAELARLLASGSAGEHRRAAALAPRLEPDLAAVARQLARRPGDLAAVQRALPRASRRFHAAALQSRVFNRVLAARLAEGALDGAELGDLVLEHATGAVSRYDPEQAAAVARRAARLEVSPTGPLPGARRLAREGRPARWERAALDAEGLALSDLERAERELGLHGDRRALRVPLRDLELAFEEDRCRLAFVLPPGSFATVLLEELRKAHAARS